MASVPSPLADPDDPQSFVESVKVKRLPRSAKKRLRYERIRQQRKQAGKKKHKTRPSSEGTTDSATGKLFKRTANERLEAINRESTAPIICIDFLIQSLIYARAKELASLARQIGRCYSANRRAVKPVQLVLANWSNDSPLAQECRRVNDGFDQYPIILTDTPIDQSYPKERLVYLSPNADQPLAEVNEEKIHIIGGLVDESVRKNMTYSSCQEKSIACYKLPIQTYMEHSVDGGTFNQILSINQVFDILLGYMTSNDWEQALKKNIPERKGWVIKPRIDLTDEPVKEISN